MIIFFYSMIDFSEFPSFASIVSILLVLLIIASMWIFFVKQNRPGWYALIPFFNTLMTFSIVWGKKKGIISLVFEASSICFYLIGAYTLWIVESGLFSIYFGHGFDLLGIVGLLYDIVAGNFPLGPILVGYGFALFGMLLSWVAYIIAMVGFVKLGRSFGKKGLFLLGMFLFPYIFMPIIAFGNSKFLGQVNGHNPNINYPFVFDPNAYYPDGYDESMNDRYKKAQAQIEAEQKKAAENKETH